MEILQNSLLNNYRYERTYEIFFRSDHEGSFIKRVRDYKTSHLASCIIIYLPDLIFGSVLNRCQKVPQILDF